jgi:outer membrane protein assembly factor BamB
MTSMCPKSGRVGSPIPALDLKRHLRGRHGSNCSGYTYVPERFRTDVRGRAEMRRTSLASRWVPLLALFASAAALASGGQLAGRPASQAGVPVPEARSLPSPVLSPASPAGDADIAPLRSAPTLDPRDFETQSAPPPTSNFAGLGDNATASIPAGTHGAVGNGYLLETLNSQMRVQYASGGGTAFAAVGLNFFWTTAVNPNSANVSNPAVAYDPEARRWIIVARDEAGTANSRLLVGVSTTDVPNPAAGSWHQTSIDVDPGSTSWADYPTIGFSAQWVVVHVNIRRVTDGALQSSRLYVFLKDLLYAGTFTPTSIDLDPATYGGSHTPSVSYDTGVTDVYLLQVSNAAAGELRLYKLTGPSLPALVGTVSAAPWVDSPGDVDFAPQAQGPPGCGYCLSPPCTRKIRVGDSRIQNVVLRNNHVWAAHTVILSPPNRSSVQWWEIGVDASIVQHGLIDDPSGQRSLAFPSIAVNKNDDVLIGYSRFDGSAFAAASYSFRSAIDPPNTMRSDHTLKVGRACYYKDNLGGRNLWGDYSSTVVDQDDVSMWTLQEYAELPGGTGTGQFDDRWGTWWGAVDPRPRVVITDAWASETAPPGTSRMVFDLSLLNADHSAPLPTSQTVSVDWRTTPIAGQATEDVDYVRASGTLYFAPGETTKTIEVTVVGDVASEGAETFYVELTASTNATIETPPARATGTILDLPVPQVSIADVTKLEGNAGSNATEFDFEVTLSYPANVAVNWQTVADTAGQGPLPWYDYLFQQGTVTFAPPSVSQTIKVFVHGDTDYESDEQFYVDLYGATGGAALARARAVGRVLNDDAYFAEASGLSILSDSTASGAGNGRNRLQWVNPFTVDSSTSGLIKYNVSTSVTTKCTAPALPTDASDGTITLDPGSLAPGKSSYTHASLALDLQYCYSLWLNYGGSYSPRVYQSARPYDSHQAGNRVLWKLATGASLMPAPTVGGDGVIAVSNDRNVHAVDRNPGSANAGLWPSVWVQPLALGALAHHRVPVVPRGTYNAAFISTEDGRVHAVDTRTGALLWSTQLPEGSALGAPAGIFIAGRYDYLLVGTTSSSQPNHFYALNPDDGAVVDVFPRSGEPGVSGDMGQVYGMATVDYANGRVYFASYRGTAQRALWCLDLGPPSDALRLRWSLDLGAGVNVLGSPVLRNGRLYVGDESGKVWSVPAGTGLGGYSLDIGAKPVRGFLFPDRGGTGRDLYAATETAVLSITDDGAGTLSEKWRLALSTPSIVLLRPGSTELYVGVMSYPNPTNSDPASLVRINTATGLAESSVPLEAIPQVVGAPSLDTEYNVIHVGSEGGVLYAVQLPF